MFASHKQHDFERIQKVYDQKVKEILIEVDIINNGLKNLKDSGKKVDE